MTATRREALAALARRYPDDYQRIYRSIKDGTPIDEVTVTEWATEWLKLRQQTARPGTLDADKAAVNKWIVPTIGGKPLAGLLRTDVRAVHDAMEAAGLANTTIQRAGPSRRDSALVSGRPADAHSRPRLPVPLLPRMR